MIQRVIQRYCRSCKKYWQELPRLEPLMLSARPSKKSTFQKPSSPQVEVTGVGTARQQRIEHIVCELFGMNVRVSPKLSILRIQICCKQTITLIDPDRIGGRASMSVMAMLQQLRPVGGLRNEASIVVNSASDFFVWSSLPNGGQQVSDAFAAPKLREASCVKREDSANVLR